MADRNKIGNVVSNLLSNAVKYSPNGGSIEVSGSVIENGVTVSVKDHGMGINEQETEHLFKRYYRVQGTNDISGFGIGLYLSAEIIQAHNGEIWVESKVGQCSTFYFSLPAAV